MTKNAPPSRNPTDNGTMPGMLRVVLEKFLQNVDDMLPAQVVSYNRKTNRARVHPLINRVTTKNEIVQRSEVASVPVMQLGGGGFVISFPIKKGDTGWIKSCDRDISLFKQTGKVSAPNTARLHNFSDGMFIPDTMLLGVTIDAEDTDNAVFQNLEGSVKIALWKNLLKIIARDGVGIGGTPASNALLDLQSTEKALIVPRMTTGQKLAISDPSIGMVVFDTDEDGLSVFSAGGGWS